MFTLGWSDGATLLKPIDVSLVSSQKSQINGKDGRVGKRTSGYKHRAELLEKSPFILPDMIQCALSSDIDISYVFMDIWLTVKG